MVQSPSENLLSLRFKEFENSLLLLEIAAESEDWEDFTLCSCHFVQWSRR